MSPGCSTADLNSERYFSGECNVTVFEPSCIAVMGVDGSYDAGTSFFRLLLASLPSTCVLFLRHSPTADSQQQAEHDCSFSF
jgi:hypothetical protein